MRDQAVSSRRKVRRRTVRSASSRSIRRRGHGSLRWILRGVPTLIYLAVLILAAWLLYYSVASPYFAVREIVVSGNKLLDTQQAQEASGSLGQNVLLLRADRVEQSVRGISVVRNAGVTMALPGRLEIDVAERTPFVQWQTREGAFLVDREGVVFSTEAPPSPVVVVRESDAPSMRVGSRVDPDVLAAIETLSVALPERAGIQPWRLDYSRSRGISVPVEGGLTVVLGDADDLDAKLASLAAIRAHLEATKARAEIIDLRFRGRPVYVLASSAPAGSGQARP